MYFYQRVVWFRTSSSARLFGELLYKSGSAGLAHRPLPLVIIVNTDILSLLHHGSISVFSLSSFLFPKLFYLRDPRSPGSVIDVSPERRKFSVCICINRHAASPASRLSFITLSSSISMLLLILHLNQVFARMT